MSEIPTPPPELGGTPRVLGTFGAAAVSSVLYGDLKDDVRRVRDSSQVPDGIRSFLTLSMPPLPRVWWEGAYDDQGNATRYRRAWLFAPDRVRVDQESDVHGMRDLVLEPLDVLLGADLEEAWAAGGRSTLTARFSHRYRRVERREGRFGRRRQVLEGEPLNGDEALWMRLTLTVAPGADQAGVEEVLAAGVGAHGGFDPLPERADRAAVTEHVSLFLRTFWATCLPGPTQG